MEKVRGGVEQRCSFNSNQWHLTWQISHFLNTTTTTSSDRGTQETCNTTDIVPRQEQIEEIKLFSPGN